MILINITNGEELNGVIEKLNPTDFDYLTNSSNFSFDWIKESENDIYKISLKGQNEILGLISLVDLPRESRIHINLIESAIKQRGKEKQILNIPACLIAFACRESFRKGYGGFVSLIPKTLLVNYYHENFGFTQMGLHMVIFMESSKSLISKYYRDEEI